MGGQPPRRPLPHSKVEVSAHRSFLVEAEPLGVKVGGLQEVLLVLGILGRGRPLGAAAPLAGGAGGGRVGAQTRLLRLLPQPRVAQTLGSAGPVPVHKTSAHLGERLTGN